MCVGVHQCNTDVLRALQAAFVRVTYVICVRHYLALRFCYVLVSVQAPTCAICRLIHMFALLSGAVVFCDVWRCCLVLCVQAPTCVICGPIHS